ncbi:hypothetical protein AAVH_36871, partial [Aphelenchoides avenae]
EGAAIGALIATSATNRRKRATRPIECETVRGLFSLADVNRDGRLSFDELKANLTETQNALTALDTDNSSFVEPTEFHSCLASVDYAKQPSGRTKRQYYVYDDGCDDCYGCSQMSTLYIPQYSTIYI